MRQKFFETLKDRFPHRLDPWLMLAIAIGAGLRFSRLGDFDNQYYTATVASMLQSPGNFLFASFDPGGMVAVDKPPLAFWLQAIPAALFGASNWSVSLPQAVLGHLAIIVLYLAVKPAFGRSAALVAAFVLAVMPVSVGMDSANEQEPLLAMLWLLATLAIIRAAHTVGDPVRGRRWRWLLAFAVLLALGFNTKMLLAFIPLPAFLLYYALAARQPFRVLATRLTAALAVLLAVSLAWVAMVALTPAAHRPYVGSTPDNSIWTLVFGYNGVERFTSFIAPRIRPIGLPSVVEPGLQGLFTNPLAEQLGWLLPLALFLLVVALIPLLHNSLRSRAFFGLLRDSPILSQTVLWAGWFVTAWAALGLARSTTTHPYYLDAVAVPLAAVIGIGLARLWQVFRQRGRLCWVLPAALLSGGLYQAYFGSKMVADWAAAAALAGAGLSVLALSLALWRKAARLMAAFAAVGVLSLLMVPAVSAGTAGERLASTGAALPRGPSGLANQVKQQRVLAIIAFIRQEGDAGSRFALGATNAREAAPFIIAGTPAIAIGGFSGNDPAFTVGPFRALAERGELRYFLMPGPRAQAWPPGPSKQEDIMRYVRQTWEDVSPQAGLPFGSLYRYRGAAARP